MRRLYSFHYLCRHASSGRLSNAILDNSRAFDNESAVRPIISSSLSMRGCAQFRYSSIRIVKRHVGILLLEGAKRYGGSS